MWTINAAFFFICVVAGFNYQVAIVSIAVVFVLLLFVWILQTSDTTKAFTVLAVCLFLGFFHEPITTGRKIYFIQEGLVIVIFLAVLMGRPSQPFRFHLAIFLPIFVFIAILMPLSLMESDILTVLNGLRKWILPFIFFFIGQLLYQEGMDNDIIKFLLWVVIIQVPAALFIGALWTGGSMVIPHPDMLSGTFGRGGTGVIAVLSPPVVVWGLWAAWAGRIPKYLAIMALAAFGILLALCEIKFAVAMVPIMFAMLTMLNMAAHKKIKKLVLNPLVIIIPAITLVLLLTVGEKLIRYEQTESGFMGGINIFDLKHIEDDLDHYLQTRGGGVRERWSAFYEEDILELTRYGMVIETIAQASKSTKGLFFGYGLDSASGNQLRESLLAKMAKVDMVTYQLFSFLLFETGLLGQFAYLAPILFFFFLALELFIRPPPGVSQELVTGVLLFTFTGIMTLFYNDILRFIQFGGVVWFVCGMFYAQRSMAQKAVLEKT